MQTHTIAFGGSRLLFAWAIFWFHFMPSAWSEEKSGRVYKLRPTDNVQYELQQRLIEATPGDVIILQKGLYRLRHTLDVVTDNVTIRGEGSDHTVMSFKGQTRGGPGIVSTGDNFVIEGLAIEDTAANAIKINGARNVTFRDVRTEWTGKPQASNGAYGLYPVLCQNVLIDGCTAIGASDAGIYVGQCRDVIVRNCHAERNVAGIEIENTINADVYDNTASNNAGGLLVFDLPGLELKNGGNVRVFRNQIHQNNHINFASPGSMVSGVSSGTGLMVMATDRVEVFENSIVGNRSSSISIISFLYTKRKLKDLAYDPYPETVSVFRNNISGGGTDPQDGVAERLMPYLGKAFPDILYDGMIDPKKRVNDELPTRLHLGIYGNGDASFVNFNLSEMDERDFESHTVNFDLTEYDIRHPPLPSVELREHDKPSLSGSAANQVFLDAPKRLSDHGLFEGNGSSQVPVSGVLAYGMNTPLFSDYADKYRFVRIPQGSRIEFRDKGVLEFPVGSLLAKTFAYPRDQRDPSKGRRLVETRIEIRDKEGWHGYSYQWNKEQTEAFLTLGGNETSVTWIDESGGEQTHRYQIPNANQCLNCHSYKKDYVPLGPTASNLNRAFEYDGESVNQLIQWEQEGLLAGLPRQHALIERLVDWHDSSSGSVAERARAWLSVNCAHCHRPGGTARSSGLDLRLSQTDPTKFGVWKNPVAAGQGTGGHSYDIVPGKPDESIMIHRLESTNPAIMMPNVSKNLVPEEAVSLLREWIEQM